MTTSDPMTATQSWMRIALPSVLSTTRLLLAVAFPFLSNTGRLWAIVAAAVSDAADGYAARRLGSATWWGGIIDAAMDKLFVITLLIVLTVEHRFAPWQLAVLLIRDAAIVIKVVWVIVHRRFDLKHELGSRVLGKATTAGLFVLFWVKLAWPQATWAHTTLFAATALFSVLAAVDYMVHLKRISCVPPTG